MKVYWAPAKARLVQEHIDGFSVFFDPLSCSTHLLTQQHLALLDELSDKREAALSFDDLVKRVCAANEIEEDADIRETLEAVLVLLQKETLAQSREAP